MMHSTPARRFLRAFRDVAPGARFVTALRTTIAIAVTMAASMTTVLVGAAPASAQPGSGQALYDAGVEAYGARDYDTACAKFAESYRTEQAAAALFMLGKCERARGKWMAARTHFQKVIETESEDAKMVEHARTEAAELAALLPRVTLRLAPSAPPASTIALDGKPASLDVAHEVDPGAHEVTVTAAGHASSTRKITLVERQVLELEVSPGPKGGAGTVEAPVPSSGSPAMRTAGIVVTSVGAALAATAIVTSVWIAAGCGGESEGNAFGCPREDDGYASPYGALLPINAVGWIGGIVGLGVGIPLIIAGGSGSGSSDGDTAAAGELSVAVAPAGIVVRGSF